MEVHFQKDVDAALERIKAKVGEVCANECRRVLVERSQRSLVQTQLQTLFNLKFDHRLDRHLYELIVMHGMAAEKSGPGACRRFLDLVFGFSVCHLGEIVPLHPTLSDVENVAYIASEPLLKSIVKDAVDLAGFGGRIVVEKTSSVVPSVELVRGYTFDLVQHLPADVNITNPRVACIDGHVNDVSEVHHLLVSASAAKEPLIVFLRGISDEVKHTLKVNYDRGSLRVIPLGVRFDLEGINTLVDVATVCGTDVVSSIKGDLISSIAFERLPYVEQVTVFKGKTLVTSNKTTRAVRAHVSQLRQRRNEVQVEDVGLLLDKRIKSLSPNHVIVRIPDDRNFIVRSQSIDAALRTIRSAVDHGIDEVYGLAATEIVARHHARHYHKTINQIGYSLSAS